MKSINNSTLPEKISCPKCQNKLFLGLEETVMHLRAINPSTGKLSKRTTKHRVSNSETRSFLFCKEYDCDFVADNEDEIYEEYCHLFKLVSEHDIDVFANSMKG